MLTATTLTPADREQVIADSLRGSPQAKRAWPTSMSQENIEDMVAAIDVRVMVIAGEGDRVDTLKAQRTELVPRIPGAVLHVVPRTGHLSPLEAPADLVVLIDRFLKELP